MTLKLNESVPDFSLPADDGSEFSLSQFRRKNPNRLILLVFYPADESPVCTAQLCEYRDGIEAFEEVKAEVIGISAQDSKSHQAFKKRRELPFTLLRDKELSVANSFGAKGLLGMKRAIFLIDSKGRLRYQHVEITALFRRSAEELLDVIRKLDHEQS
jgi:thioredoxin-dependent peroxiredoxin